MRKRSVFSILFLIFLGSTVMLFPAEKVKVGIIKQIDIPPLLTQAKEVIKTLEEAGYTKDKAELIEVTANGNMESIKNIVNDMRKSNVKLFITIGTSASIEVLKLVKDIPVVVSVSYEESLKEAKEKFKLGNNYTAALMYVPALPVLKMALKIKKINKIGIIYYEKEDNAKKDVALLLQDCKTLKLQPVAFPYSKEEEILATFTQMLNSGVDCVILPKDTLLVKQFDKIRPLVDAKKILVLGIDDASTDANISIISISVGYDEIGRLLGRKAGEILKGKKIADVPVEGIDRFHVIVNLKIAKKIGLIIPVDIIRSANRIIKE